MKRRFSFARVCNCWLFVASLALCGRLRGVVLVWDSPIPHALGITWRGNVVHFRRTRGEPRVCSLWLTGVPEMFRISVMDSITWRKTKVMV